MKNFNITRQHKVVRAFFSNEAQYCITWRKQAGESFLINFNYYDADKYYDASKSYSAQSLSWQHFADSIEKMAKYLKVFLY